MLLVDRQPELAERTLEMIGADGEAAAWEPTSHPRGCEGMVAEALRRWGKLDILDNNVGIGIGGTVVDVPEERWELQMRVNVTSMMLASKAAIPAMRAAGGGAIVNVSSIASHRPRGLTPYAASKGRGSAHAGDGRRSRARRHPRQLHRARPRLHAPRLRRRDVGRTARAAPALISAWHRGHRLGRRLRRSFSCRMKPGTSPASPSQSTAACSSTESAERRRTTGGPPAGRALRESCSRRRCARAAAFSSALRVNTLTIARR